MIAIVTVLLAFPLGFFLRSHLAANVAYAIAYLWAFTFQGLYLTRMWVGGDDSAFPKNPDTMPVGYGLVTLAIFAVGFGLVAVGQRVGSRRRSKAPAHA
ncbi:hypothetical protein [Aeromicrobium sp. 9AM]|uniref:hypothetical protein n=1 Tax=Aeromicrobium sp. 9AM TaxID=2653126 RepID=UPI0012F40853|nr:hypothetical protein [Aeromicrobium sp. 9AM]VXA94646.1 conserved hypothetical protein [Aeromicrobium sp. 9AM]